MVIYSCTMCGWNTSVMIARVFLGMAPSVTMSVTVRSTSFLSALAMKTIRSLARSVTAIPLSELQEQLEAPIGVDLGPQSEYRARELLDLLEPLGFAVESKPCEPDKTMQGTPNGAADRKR